MSEVERKNLVQEENKKRGEMREVSCPAVSPACGRGGEGKGQTNLGRKVLVGVRKDEGVSSRVPAGSVCVCV